MDHLYSPWRFSYVRRGVGPGGCLFCQKSQSAEDEANLVLHRGLHAYALLNLYPYSVGHLMIAPYAHVATLAEASPEALTETVLLARHAEEALRTVYDPPGFNMGWNIGECAGAGVAGHLHLHVLPRWPGDDNFLTTIGETRVLPEELPATYRRLAPLFTP